MTARPSRSTRGTSPRAFAWIGAVLLLAAMPALAADRLPSRLTDAEFWSFIQNASELGGTFESENWISNEIGLQSVMPRLSEMLGTGGVYIGVGPEQNFTLIASLRPRVAFVVDIRHQNTLQHLLYKALFELSPTRSEFVSRLFSRARAPGVTERSTVVELFDAYRSAPADRQLFDDTVSRVTVLLRQKHGFAISTQDLATLGRLLAVFREFGPAITYGSRAADSPPPDSLVPPMPSYAELMSLSDWQGVRRSYLASEQQYRVVRDLQQRNLIVPVTGDFAGPKTLRTIGQFLKDRNATVSAFYASNVENYLFRLAGRSIDGGLKRFYENVATLPLDRSSLFIRSGNGTGPLPAGGMPYSTLGSIQGTLAAVNDGRARTPADLFNAGNIAETGPSKER
jgi:hypothetical protein